MMFWYDHNVSGWGWFGMSLGMLVFWGLIITAFILLFRSLGRGQDSTGPAAPPPGPPPATASPEQLLADRFARGEIDEDEYRRRLQVLREGGPTLTKH
ncbi:SHOCT domain-containing protein [Streptomyces canus]|uniref:SHOCT domain-containing protein n=1 Tax=Streptomyces canus TaxID=58343 RepID=UPI0036E339F7